MRQEALVGTGGVAQYEYDLRGKLTALVNARNYRTEYEYDSMGRLTRATNAALNYTAYSYDLAGNQTQMIDRKGQVVTYGYDLMNRLTLVRPTGMVETTHTYDYLGNKLTMTDATGTTTYEYNNLDQVTSSTAPSGTTTYQYDLNGNQIEVTTSAGTRTFGYNALNQQISTSGVEGDGTYAYDGLGRRIAKTESGVTKQYLCDGDFVLLELDGSSAYTTRNLYGRDYLGRTTLSGTPEYMSFLLNGHTDVTALLAADGTTTANSYYYDAWGNFLERTETAYNDLYYAQQEFDDLTGNYHMGARYYAPGLGRFTSADSWTELPDDERGYTVGNDPLRFNLYAYCLDNPLKYIDPSGHREIVGDDPRTETREERSASLQRERERPERERVREERYVSERVGSTSSWAEVASNISSLVAILKRSPQSTQNRIAHLSMLATSIGLSNAAYQLKKGFITTGEFLYQVECKIAGYVAGKVATSLKQLKNLSTTDKAILDFVGQLRGLAAAVVETVRPRRSRPGRWER